MYDEIKYHIILGDGGFLWPGDEEYEFLNYWELSKRQFPVLCVMGNHDPVLGRSDLPEIDIGIGEKVIVVNKEKPFVAYLKRGKIYKIEDHIFLVLGGALSINSENNVPFIKGNFLNYINAASFISSLLGGTAAVCDTTRGCIVSVFDQAMRPFFSQDNLIDMLSANDLDMGEIGKEKTAVFLIIPDENTLYHRLISVFVKQCYTELIIEAQKQPLRSLPRRVNFLLDEFSSLPQISDFPAMITASRSRNIRFNLIVQSINQLWDRYGRQAETIRGNCENWVFLHSREYYLLEELVNLSDMRNHEDPLVSVSMLQTLDKDKGEAFILHKRRHPYIASLPDIDSYPCIAPNGVPVEYPKNSCKAETVFDFEKFCRQNGTFFLSNLFTEKTHEEIRNISCEEEERYYMTDDDDVTIEPIFTSRVLEEV